MSFFHYRWFDELMRSGLKPTTVHSYLQDVLSFLRYLHEADLSHVKLSDRSIRSLMFLLKSFRKQGKRQLSLHRQLVQDHGQGIFVVFLFFVFLSIYSIGSCVHSCLFRRAAHP